MWQTIFAQSTMHPEADAFRSPISEWEDDQVLAAYAGLPRRLADAGPALGLPADKQKLKIGSDLIRFFCVPYKGTFRDPAKYPEKWQQFIEYNRQDVLTEKEIRRRLIDSFGLPRRESIMWQIDQKINDRGIMIDLSLANQAIKMANGEREKLLEEAKDISHLDNPNSVAQLKNFLELEEDQTLRKADVAAMLGTVEDKDKRRILEIRSELCRSSVKKYEAMVRSACPDGRVRGSILFYGAQRTGRFAGRLIQPQNYPQNHLPDKDLDYARTLVKEGDSESIQMFYGSINDTLSQLTRTALVPKEGCTFVVADFSAIEARVLAWESGERWVSDAFANGEDIYCRTASEMFGVPVVKNGINGELRQKGKVAVLACIAEGQLVTTDHGNIPIEQVTTDMRVWDGEDWVQHDGVICNGMREVISYDGLTATPDHLVFVEGTPWAIRFDEAAASGAHLVQPRVDRDPFRKRSSNFSRKALEQNLAPVLRSDAMHQMRRDPMVISEQSAARQELGVPGLFQAETDSSLVGSTPHSSEATLRESERPALQELRWSGNQIRISECTDSRAVSDPDLRCSGPGIGTRSNRQQRELCSGESEAGIQTGELRKSFNNGPQSIRSEVLALCGNHNEKKAICGSDTGRDYQRSRDSGIRKTEELEKHQGKVRVYDIRNAGRHHRFTVSNRLVHNCGYAGSVGALKAMGADKMGLSDEELQTIVDKWRTANSHTVKFWYAINDAVWSVMKGNQNYVKVGCLMFSRKVLAGIPVLVMTLPSGRSLFYHDPQIGVNRFGGESLTYMGMEAGKWSRLETYYGKLTENATQAIARDCLCVMLYRLEKKGYRTVCHIHDEAIVEVETGKAEQCLKDMLEIMSEPISWAPDLKLKGAGYITPYYRKD